MNSHFDVHLSLSADTPDSMNFVDTYEGLDDIWYRFESDDHGNVTLLANENGFEHLARVFLKFSRGRKSEGYHHHGPLEFGTDHYVARRELTIGLTRSPLLP